jgi:hypothetical protein
LNTGLEGTSLILLDKILGEVQGKFLHATEIGLAGITSVKIGAHGLLAVAALVIQSAIVIPVVAAVVEILDAVVLVVTVLAEGTTILETIRIVADVFGDVKAGITRATTAIVTIVDILRIVAVVGEGDEGSTKGGLGLLDNILGEEEGEFLGAAEIGLAGITIVKIGAHGLLAVAALVIISAIVIPVVPVIPVAVIPAIEAAILGVLVGAALETIITLVRIIAAVLGRHGGKESGQ